ncbi:hypothetical protein FJZ40_02595 [Candidatus Shapirobacteria bacterium]|nr:hypothetical protein [Candidatus Shapirobacteria bacterium]
MAVKEEEPLEVLPVREVKTLLSWKAPARPFKKRNREFWTTVLTIVILISLILLFVKEWFLIATIIALTFVYYVLSTVPPDDLEYTITSRGIRFAEAEYPWEVLFRFWFSKKWEQELLNFEFQNGYRLTWVLGSQDKAEVQEVLEKFLPLEEARPTFFDRASDWIAKKFPLESLEKSQ